MLTCKVRSFETVGGFELEDGLLHAADPAKVVPVHVARVRDV